MKTIQCDYVIVGTGAAGPVLAYYLALWQWGVGERETLLHLALWPFPLVSSLAFLGICRRLAPARGCPS